MTEPRLKSKISVMAAVRLSQSRGLFATIARKGDEDAGAVLVKQNLLGGGFRVLTQVRSIDGKADAYIARQVGRDFDIWVVEIEDRQGRNPFEEPAFP